jgi:hypothetical protein
MQNSTPSALPTFNCRLQASLCLVLCAFCLLQSSLLGAQDSAPSPPPANVQEAEPPPDQPFDEDEKPLPGDWAVALLDKIANSPNPEARNDLMRAVMKTGPAVIPLLEPGLADDRTAEFAAQALAFIGGEKALKLLWELQKDPRDLNLRRFFYGALAEFDTPDATATLLAVIRNADAEPDRTVTETAIVALTVRANPQVLPALREARQNIKDLVIQLDLESAIEVIERRARQTATGPSKTGGSIEAAVRHYFSPALDSVPPGEVSASRPAVGAPAKPAARPALPPSNVKVRIEDVAVAPNQARALARVTFEDPTASATYDIVLQKQLGDWTVASVWPGAQVEKTLPETSPPKPRRPPAAPNPE